MLDQVLVLGWSVFMLIQVCSLLVWVYPLLLISSLGSVLYSRLIEWFAFLRIDIRGKRILITGCDSGFGYFAAKRLDQLGCIVYANCLTKNGAEQLKEQCSKRLVTLVFDVTQDAQVLQAAETLIKEFEGEGKELWALVNNAGIGLGSFVEGTSIEDTRKIFEVNVFGVIRVTKAFLPLLRKNRRCPGRVINIASLAGRVAELGMGSYSASKFAIEAFSDALRREMIPFGVQVSIIEPGYFKTAILTPAVELQKSFWSKVPDQVKKAYGEGYNNWIIKNMEVANAVAENPAWVVTEIVRCCYAKWPAIRVPVGIACLGVVMPVSMLPASVLDLRYHLQGPPIPR
jgi:NAD(P)-dependent dehydrogenase (short-subunit alcohol dehydrogenase family)